MKILTIISNFITQYIPDFAGQEIEYLLLAILTFIIIGVFTK